MKSTRKKTPGHSAKEYFIVVFETFSESKDLYNMKAVHRIGKLTDKQYEYLCKDFEAHNKLGLARIISEDSITSDDEFRSKMLQGKVTELLDLVNLPVWCRSPIDAAIDLANKIRTRSGCEHENIRKIAAGRSDNTPQTSEPANAKRDARILELRKEGKPFKDVCDIVNKEFNDMLSEKDAEIALTRHCKRNNIEYPYGKRGRRST